MKSISDFKWTLKEIFLIIFEENNPWFFILQNTQPLTNYPGSV